MVKNHLKRISMPRTWKLKRKESQWVTRPKPGAHSLMTSMALETVMKELIKCANTRKEARIILFNKEVLVDGKKRRDLKLPVGLMDVVSLPEINEYYRILINNKNEIVAKPIKKEESLIKPCRIICKTKRKKGETQVNLFDSKNITLKKGEDSAYKVGDTLVISLPKQEIKEHFKLEKGSYAYLTGGRYVGTSGKIESIEKEVVIIKSEKGKTIETSKKNIFVLGKDKPAITII